jgi:uncharacterized membrane protein YadS
MTTPISSTADLTPAGILGYAKLIAAAVSGVLVVIVPFFPLDSVWARWVQGGIALCGAIAVYAIPNLVKSVPAPGVDLAP